MSSSTRGETLQDLIRTILEASAGGANGATLRDALRFFSSIVRLDYAAALHRQFDSWQVHELLSEVRRFLPDLNRKVFSETRVSQLSRKAADLGAVLQARRYDGERGRALRGFYLSADSTESEPVVYVNTAGHPVMIAAAFWHEVGHHLTHEILGGEQGTLNLSFTADYASHLNSLDELAADIVMTLGCYPRRAAERVFGAEAGRDSRPETLIMSAREYVRRTTGLDFDRSTPAQENVPRLAGMIHLAKLRAALLTEYGI